MVHAAAAADGVLFQSAQARRGLARVGDAGVGPPHGRDIGRGEGGDARQSAHEIQRNPFGGQYGAGAALGPGEHGAGGDMVSIVYGGLEADVGIDQRKRQAGAVQAGHHAGLARGELHAQPGLRVHTGRAGHIAGVAEVLGQGGADDGLDDEVRNSGQERGFHSAAALRRRARACTRVVMVRRAGEAIRGKSAR